MTRVDKRRARAEYAPKRLDRIRRLRRMGAPRWIVKTEQIAMVLNRAGLRNAGIGKDGSQRQQELYARHVLPLLEEISAEAG